MIYTKDIVYVFFVQYLCRVLCCKLVLYSVPYFVLHFAICVAGLAVTEGHVDRHPQQPGSVSEDAPAPTGKSLVVSPPSFPVS